MTTISAPSLNECAGIRLVFRPFTGEHRAQLIGHGLRLVGALRPLKRGARVDIVGFSVIHNNPQNHRIAPRSLLKNIRF